MTLTDALGYIAGFLVLLTFSMKTMVQLRIVGIASNIFFISYAYFSDAFPIMVLHGILLPLNILRLYQLLDLIRRVDEATRGNPDFDWLKTITSRRSVAAGEILFLKKDPADSMMFVVSGKFRVRELGVELSKGDVIGELGLLSPDKTRTQSVECIEGGELLEITYGQVKLLYFQSPKFGFYFLQLASRRLFENLERQDQELAQYRTTAARSI
jgi:hypothetical protein